MWVFDAGGGGGGSVPGTMRGYVGSGDGDEEREEGGEDIVLFDG